MRRPSVQNTFNWNSVLIVAVALVGWGVTWQSLRSEVAANKADIERIEAKQNKIETDVRGFSAVEFRVGALENSVTSVTSSQRDTDRTVSQLASDIRVIRQIVERLDESRNGSPSRNFPR